MSLKSLFILVLAIALLGSAASSADILRIPLEEEVSLGRTASTRFESKVRLMGGPQLARIRRIGDRIVAKTDRRELPFTFKLVDSPNLNAITFPGGFIYVFRGLLDAGIDDDELAGVLGHEITHAVKSHGVKTLFPALLLRRMQARLSGQEREHAISTLLEVLGTRGIGRHLEMEADRLGVQFAAQAGYRADGLLRVLELFERMQRQSPSRMQQLMATHPPPAERIRRLKPVVDGLSGNSRPR